MSIDSREDTVNSEDRQDTPRPEEEVPSGIARLRREWQAWGLPQEEPAPQEQQQEEAPVVFSEVDGGAGIGDYTLEYETVVERLGLTADAVDRLLMSGELDSILLQKPGEQPRRMISEASFSRFQQDSAMAPEALERAARAMADQTLVSAIEALRNEIEELKGSQGRILQQMKDLLLLEIRNLKEQDRDLTSFVYELAEEIRSAINRKRR